MILVLFMSVRDTDYIGWYRQSRILGILLTALRPDSAREGLDSLKTRLMDRLRRALTLTRGQSLQIRVLEAGEITAFTVSDHPAQFPISKGQLQ
jgi:hypothetical protein